MQFYPSGNNVIFPGFPSDGSHISRRNVGAHHINMYRYLGRMNPYHRRSLSSFTCVPNRLDAVRG